MILRRFAEALKQQNWAAIAIEFVLLVLGVFLGIQMSNWNQERETAKKAAVFTQRLREDLRVEAWRFEAINRYYENVRSNAERTLYALEGKLALSNEALLIAAYRATQYAEFVQYRATYDELTSTGNIVLIADPTLRRLATEVYSTGLYQNVKNEGVNSRYRVAFRMLVPLDVQTAIATNCGDKTSEVNNYRSIENLIDYECSTGLPPRDIDSTATLLRSDAALVPLLRLRITDINSAVGTRVMSQAVLQDLEALSGKRP
ncbi:MAG: hypothetical protein A3E01_04850 [Gammaproteobacteria bacterium RIFCSPHIGHO2_12_FULL_63_22]|nr:MAG: hypothetical protein A3E01_04850 [Gammaproteobacteria bacterium RIFCSPHIGHO2_12_FULL_63_22]